MSMKYLRGYCALAALATGGGFGNVAYAQQGNSIEGEDEIIVTGSPIKRTELETLSGFSVLRGEELDTRQAANLGELLKYEPGISSTFFGPGASRPVIRGQGGNRVQILENGIVSVDVSASSPDHAVATDSLTAERVEVLRGSGLLRYGSSASGGVVNVIDEQLSGTVPEEGLEGAIRASLSTVDEGKEIAGKVNFLATPNLVLHLSGSHLETEDYDIPGMAESEILHEAEGHDDHDEDEEDHEEAEGILENSFTEKDTIRAGMTFLLDNGFLAFSARKTDHTYGVPGHHHHEEEEDHHDDEEEEHEEEGVFIELEQTRYDMNGRFDVDLGPFETIALFGGIADYEHTEFEGLGEPGTVFTNEGWDARAELIQREQNGWRGAVGLHLNNRDFSAIGDEAYVPPVETEQTGIYTFQEVSSGAWHFEGAARFENTSHETETGVTRDFDGVSVSAGADYHFSETMRAGVTLFRTERAPAAEELYSNGPHIATSQFEIGDPDLDMETATGLEVAIRHRGDGHAVTLNLFRTNYDGFIYDAPTGGEEDELPVYQFQANDGHFTGFELAAEADLGVVNGFVLGADGAIEYVHAELDVENNDNLPRIPPLGILAGVTAQSDRLSLRAEIDHADEVDKTALFELPTESYTQVNAFASFRPFADHDGLTVRLAGTNLTDEEIRQHTSPLKDLVPLPGRSVKVTLDMAF